MGRAGIRNGMHWLSGMDWNGIRIGVEWNQEWNALTFRLRGQGRYQEGQQSGVIVLNALVNNGAWLSCAYHLKPCVEDKRHKYMSVWSEVNAPLCLQPKDVRDIS